MSHRLFAERLNQALDEIEAPEQTDERIEVLSKLIKIPKFKAEALLNGVILPDEALMEAICAEFEVESAWLLGQDDK